MTLTSGQYHIDEPFEADINIRRTPGGVRILARWRGRVLNISLPDRATEEDLYNFLNNRAEVILSKRPDLAYNLDQIIDAREIDFTIRQSNLVQSDRVELYRKANGERGKNYNYYIDLGRNAANIIGDPDVQSRINDMIISGLRNAAALYIIPRANRCAMRVRLRPRRWEIKDSKRNLGTCGANGVITLSPRLMFLPDELRDFVIYHELAHLSQMNHSAAFHEICNRYVDGNEAELSRQLKEFYFPLI